MGPRGSGRASSLKSNHQNTPTPSSSSHQIPGNMYSDLESDMDLNDDNQSVISS